MPDATCIRHFIFSARRAVTKAQLRLADTFRKAEIQPAKFLFSAKPPAMPTVIS